MTGLRESHRNSPLVEVDFRNDRASDSTDELDRQVRMLSAHVERRLHGRADAADGHLEASGRNSVEMDSIREADLDSGTSTS